MIVIQFFFVLAWIAIALRTERNAPFLRAAWILFSLTTLFLALSRLPIFRSPGPLRSGDFATTLFFFACAVVAYIFSLLRREPQITRRFLWDRSYEE